jgi:hypothetical protein
MRKPWSSVALLLCCLLAAGGCTIGRWYVGSPVRDDPAAFIAVGETAKSQVLAHFGPPDRILRQRDGDVFIYRYEQRNSSELDISEPIRGFTLFRWDKVQDKSDRLMVFFDPTGIVSAFGYRHGRSELEPL